MKWIKIWTEETVRGTTFSELSLSERGVWFSLLAMAGDSPQEGVIFLREGIGYDVAILSQILNCDKQELDNAINRLISVKKVTKNSENIIEICNWKQYQDDYHRYNKRNYRLKNKVVAKLSQSCRKVLLDQEEKKKRREEEKNIVADKPQTEQIKKESEKPYEKPTDPLGRMVLGWKLLQGYQLEDRSWDKAHWGRTAKAAKSLLDFFSGDHRIAMICMAEIKKKMDKLNLSCTMETIQKHSAEWRIKNEQFANRN